MKREMVTEDRGEVPVSRACELTLVSRSGYYRSLTPRGYEDWIVRRSMLEATDENPEYGYRRITAELRDLGYPVNGKRVLRLMREEDRLCRIRGRAGRCRTTDSDHKLPVYPDLARGLVLTGPNQLWVGDVTYLRLAGGGFVYLASLMDAWSRRVIGWEVMAVLDVRLPLRALEQALATREVRPGLVHHSDRGCQYAAKEYVNRAESGGLVMSMARRGQPRDNAKAESLFATLKCEHVYLTEYEDLADARAQVAEFVERYNTTRRHSALRYMSPERFEAAGSGARQESEGDRRRGPASVQPLGMRDSRGHLSRPVFQHFPPKGGWPEGWARRDAAVHSRHEHHDLEGRTPGPQNPSPT